MSRTGALLLALATLLPGCGSVQRAYNDLTSNHYYMLDGYRIDGPYAFLEHKKEPNETKMTLGFGYGQKILTDKDCDNVIDTIEFKNEFYHRGDPGSDELFAQADKEWLYCYEQMHVAEVDAKWKGMSETEIAQTGGYSKYKH